MGAKNGPTTVLPAEEIGIAGLLVYACSDYQYLSMTTRELKKSVCRLSTDSRDVPVPRQGAWPQVDQGDLEAAAKTDAALQSYLRSEMRNGGRPGSYGSFLQGSGGVLSSKKN